VKQYYIMPPRIYSNVQAIGRQVREDLAMLRVGVNLSIFVIVSLLAIAGASAQIVFEEDFSTEKNKWESLTGNWEIKDGKYVDAGTANVHNYGELQDPTFSGDLTYEIAVTPDENTLQASGFGIWQDDQNYYIFWICGLANTVDLLRVSIGGTQFDWNTDPASYKIAKVREAREYPLKIVVKGDTVTTYADGEKIHEVEVAGVSGIEGRLRCTNWGGYTVVFDDLLVYGPEGPAAVYPSSKLASSWGQLKLKR